MSRRWQVTLGALGTLALALAALCLTTGCAQLGYYQQSVAGHLDLMSRARPVAEWLADPATSPALRERLALSQRMRDFAVQELALPDNRSYRSYADLQRPAAVWNVVAAPELSLQLKTWCFPVVGCVGYRGYYDRADADATAQQLRAEGWEVAVYGVPAYSTLGKLDWLGGDPLLNTFVPHQPEGEVARLIFHELAHQVVFVPGDTMFNESYATAVERLGGALWLERAGPAAREEYARHDQRRRQFRELTQRVRHDLDAIYRSAEPDDVKRRLKAERMARLADEYRHLKDTEWGGFAGYDGWFQRANNAAFGVQAAYADLVPGFERLFDQNGRDFARFHAAVRRLADLPKAERDATLRGER